MKIGIDISQIAHEGTGVSNYLIHMVENLVAIDHKNEYILFYSSLRKPFPKEFQSKMNNKNVSIKTYKIPPVVLDFLWNTLHIIPIEIFTGRIDIFVTSDWAEPPALFARKVTIVYDFIVYKFPEEMHNKTTIDVKKLRIISNIVRIQKRKLSWVKKESRMIFCISEATKKDAMEILGIPLGRLHVIHPGLSLAL